MTCGCLSDFGGFAQLVLALGLEMVRFLVLGWSGTVLPLSLRLVAVLGAGGNIYSGRSFLYNSLNQLISFRQLLLTIMDLGSNAVRYRPESDLTLESAT